MRHHHAWTLGLITAGFCLASSSALAIDPRAALPCPKGTELVGDKPPYDTKEWCVLRNEATGQMTPHGPMREWYPTGGGVKLYGEFHHGKRHGRWMEWNEQEHLLLDMGFKQEVMDGAYEAYLQDGTRLVGAYKDGKRHGFWEAWGPDGKKQFSGNMRNDQREGGWSVLSEDGQHAQGGYKAGKREGKWVFKDARERLIAEGTFKADTRQGPWSDYDPVKGVVVRKGVFDKDQRHGKWSFFFPDGSIQAEGTYARDIREGAWVEWAGPGSQRRRWEGPYKGDAKSGIWSFYSENNVLLARGDMQNNVMTGEWKHFNEAGLEVAVGRYVEGKRVGLWVERNATGERYEGDYVEGERHGTWKAFNMAGELLGELTYSQGVRLN